MRTEDHYWSAMTVDRPKQALVEEWKKKFHVEGLLYPIHINQDGIGHRVQKSKKMIRMRN